MTTRSSSIEGLVVPIRERFTVQLRGEALNVSDSARFANPSGTNVSNMSLNADGSLRTSDRFVQITGAAPLGLIIDQWFFRLSLRFHQ